MMRIVILISLNLLAIDVAGQQQNQHTQFSHAKLNYNPALAGLNDQFSVTGRHRNQWAGIEGSPQGQTLLIDFPTVYNSLGFGLSMNRSSIGIQQKTDLTGMYAYKLQLNNASISLGLQASFRQFVNDFTKEGLIAIDGFEIDPTIQRKRFTQNIFNLGIGAYLQSERYYLGLSVPRTIRADIDSANDNNLSKEVAQLYAMFGLSFKLNLEWKLEPHVLLKLAEQSPYDLDVQTNFIYRDQVHLGMNIRAGGTQTSYMESLAVLIGFQFTPSIFASLSFDFNATELRQYEDGSLEILLRYRLPKNKTPKNIQNPRYY